MQMIPYGASVDVICTSTSKSDIGLNENYFITSDKMPMQMTFDCIEENGYVVGMTTNLEVIGEPISTTNESNKRVYTFTVSNENIFSSTTYIEPFIELYCNDVKVECCFTNEGYPENGFSNINISNDELNPCSNEGGNGCHLARYIKIGWTKGYNPNLYFGEDSNSARFYGFFSAHDSKLVNDAVFERFDVSIDHGDTEIKISIPPLQEKNYKFFRVGYAINFSGESNWVESSIPYVEGTNKVYNKAGGYYSLCTERINLNHSRGCPSLYSLDMWGESKSFYKGTTSISNKEVYVLASSGIQVKYQWI